MKREGVLYIISAPSGAGKTTLCKEVIDIFPELRHSVSYTTRRARPGEEHGRDYFFVSTEEFERMVAAGEFAEWAEVHGNLYGTALKTLDEYRAAGVDVIRTSTARGRASLRSATRAGCSSSSCRRASTSSAAGSIPAMQTAPR